MSLHAFHGIQAAALVCLESDGSSSGPAFLRGMLLLTGAAFLSL